ncbi:MAG: orotidine 5'-phosphate decarboxylase [Candidatus Bathyarchaeota archaeon]|nr:orotidine 5'-phosphate decarboxylase [Candidatus Bathyarchaeota archaeon]
MNRFKHRIEEAAISKGTRLILSLDPIGIDISKLESYALEMLEKLSDYICGVKLNWHLLLPLSLHDISRITSRAHESGVQCIADCKLNDIGSTNEVAVRYLMDAGFDAVTVNPFIGWMDGVDTIVREASVRYGGIILLTYMSHKGASEGYGRITLEDGRAEPFYRVFAYRALRWGCDGVVVGATRTDIIREVYGILGEDIPIYSPGVGIQGGSIVDALKSGAKYVIVGRSILYSQNPEEEARRLVKIIDSTLCSP